MHLLEKIKDIFFDVKNDLESCLIHANDLLIRSPAKDRKVLFTFVIVILLVILFRSNSKDAFYINISIVIFISFISYFIFCLSDYFWFLIKKKQVYQLNLKFKRNINILIKQKRKERNDYGNINLEDEISSIAKYYSYGYKIHTKRYAAEILVFLLILLFTFPLFFLFNLFLFCVMFFYVFFWERQSAGQAFDDIYSLLCLIHRFHKENPEECKRYITKNNQKKIKDLSVLYRTVLKKM